MSGLLFPSLLASLGAFVLVAITSVDVSAQQCMGVGCNTQNTCSSFQASDKRNCCCQPQCGPEGCYACIQSCNLSCAFSCPSCDSPLCGGFLAGEGFSVSPELIGSASKVHRVAGIVLQGRSVGGTVPIHSELVTGGTNIYGGQIAFAARIEAKSDGLTMDITFSQFEGAAAVSLPEDVRFEVDRSGEVSVGPLPPEARIQIERSLAVRRIPCELVLAAATVPIH